MDYSQLFSGESVEALYLDDVRVPRPNYWFRWVVVRSYPEFCNYIRQQGVPRFVSFDHDLGEEALQLGARSNWQEFDYSECSEMTGYDCAKFLVEYCLDNDIPMPHFTVHSANPAGAENILSLLNNLQREQGQVPNGYRTHW